MEINDVSVLDIAHSRAISLIKEGGPTVKLLLQKGDGSVPDLGNHVTNFICIFHLLI